MITFFTIIVLISLFLKRQFRLAGVAPEEIRSSYYVNRCGSYTATSTMYTFDHNDKRGN